MTFFGIPVFDFIAAAVFTLIFWLGVQAGKPGIFWAFVLICAFVGIGAATLIPSSKAADQKAAAKAQVINAANAQYSDTGSHALQVANGFCILRIMYVESNIGYIFRAVANAMNAHGTGSTLKSLSPCYGH